MIISWTLSRPLAMICQFPTTTFRNGSLFGQQECSDNVLTRSGCLLASHSHEGGDVVGEQFGRIRSVGLVGLAGAARIKRNASEMLGIVGDLEGVAGVVSGKVRDEHKRLSRSLGLVIHRDVVDFDLGH
jgi:hypothetical protein